MFTNMDFTIHFKHIISLTSFRDTLNSMRIMYNTSLLTDSEAFLNSMNSRWVVTWLLNSADIYRVALRKKVFL
jgi:ribonuclease HI